MRADKQIRLLSPSIWRELSDIFKNNTGKSLELKETIFSKFKEGKNRFQQITYYFLCDGVRAGIAIGINNKILNNIKNHKDIYDDHVREASLAMLEEYNRYMNSKDM